MQYTLEVSDPVPGSAEFNANYTLIPNTSGNSNSTGGNSAGGGGEGGGSGSGGGDGGGGGGDGTGSGRGSPATVPRPDGSVHPHVTPTTACVLSSFFVFFLCVGFVLHTPKVDWRSIWMVLLL